MARGGKRVGSGRKAGSKTKKTLKLLEEVQAGGETPLQYMLRVMRDPAAEDARRDDMAKAAAPYVHSKMPTAIVTPPPARADVTDEDEQLLKLYLHALHDGADES